MCATETQGGQVEAEQESENRIREARLGQRGRHLRQEEMRMKEMTGARSWAPKQLALLNRSTTQRQKPRRRRRKIWDKSLGSPLERRCFRYRKSAREIRSCRSQR